MSNRPAIIMLGFGIIACTIVMLISFKKHDKHIQEINLAGHKDGAN